MSAQPEQTSRPWAPERYRHEAQSPAAKRPAGDVVCFLLDTVPQLTLRRGSAPSETETRGAPLLDPAMMVCLVLDADCVGVLSRRKMAWACARHLACMAIVGQARPDFRTISDVRKQPLEPGKAVFVQGGRGAGEAGLVQRGTGATDGTNLPGKASRHKARRYG